MVGCWHGYLSIARCRLAYGPADAAATSLASVKSRLVLPFWYRLTWVVPEKGPLNVCVCVCVHSIELFQKMCDELKDWIGEKTSGINLDDVGKDLASVKLLQRKQQNLEQELRPIEDKINKMSLMANGCVSRSHLIDINVS